MPARRVFIKSAIALFTLLTASPIAVQAAKPSPVVATFSILGDMVERIVVVWLSQRCGQMEMPMSINQQRLTRVRWLRLGS